MPKPTTAITRPEAFAPPAWLFSVDLGKRKLGVAAFDPSARLQRAATLDVPGVYHPEKSAAAAVKWACDVLRGQTMDQPARWVCEWPQKYDNFRVAHENIDDLLAVGAALGPWTAKYAPREWKGNVPKGPHHQRLARALDDDEKTRLHGAGHDTWDAVGIGLFALGRTLRGGIAP